MKKVRAIISTLVLLVILVSTLFISIPSAQAAETCSSVTYNPNPPTVEGYTVYFDLPESLFANGNDFEIRMRNTDSWFGSGWDSGALHTIIDRTNHTVSRRFTSGFAQGIAAGDTYQYMVVFKPSGDTERDYCTATSPPIGNPNALPPTCSDSFVSVPSRARLGVATTLTFNVATGMQNFAAGTYGVSLNGTHLCSAVVGNIGANNCTTKTVTFTQPTNQIEVKGFDGQIYCVKSVTVTENGATVGEGSVIDSGEYNLCDQISDSDNFSQQKINCQTCYDNNGIWTAVGCIKRDAKSIAQEVLRIGLGIAGGVALLMILAAGFLFSTSQGDVKRTTQARELMSAAVIGLLFIIFSVTILQFIGVTIFQIPGFGQ